MGSYIQGVAKEYFGTTEGVFAIGGEQEPPRDGAWMILSPPAVPEEHDASESDESE